MRLPNSVHRIGAARAASHESGDGLVAATAPRSLAAEAYRTLRTNIQFSSLDRELRTILVTSAGPGEGKSTVLANLAVVIAESGRRVVAVDCDLRRPNLHTLFRLDDVPGITTMMLEEGSPPPLKATPVPRLSLIASGPLPPNPAELLGSDRFARIIGRLRDEADVVLFDSPPITAASDAAVLAARVDGVLLVVDSGRTRRDLAAQAKAQLERVGAHLLGVVLMNVKPERSMYGYHDGGR